MIYSISGSLSLMDVWWGCDFSALSFLFCPFCLQQQTIESDWWDMFMFQILASFTGGVCKLKVCSSSSLTISKDLAESMFLSSCLVLADHNHQVNAKMSFTVREQNINIPPAVFVRTNICVWALVRNLKKCLWSIRWIVSYTNGMWYSASRSDYFCDALFLDLLQ